MYMFYMQGLLLTFPCHSSDRRPSQGASPGRIQTLGPHSWAPKALLWPRHHVQSNFSFSFPNIPYILLLYSLEFVIFLLTKFSIVANYSWQRCSCYENPLVFIFNYSKYGGMIIWSNIPLLPSWNQIRK